MSADNWGICPKCKIDQKEKAQSAYGKVSEEEYLAIIAEPKKLIVDNSLREDYEIFTNKHGIFSVSYHCYCEVCGFKFVFKYSEDLLPGDKESDYFDEESRKDAQERTEHWRTQRGG